MNGRTILSKVFRNTYRDSFLLMKLATALRKMPGVRNAEVMQATMPNKALLSRGGLLTEEIQGATPNDLFVCVAADDPENARRALEHAEGLLERGLAVQEETPVSSSLRGALTTLPGANLALISIPGPYVKKEALKALGKGLNLFIFSNNVDPGDEIEIKKEAIRRGLLVMGPDCGTAILQGVALGFANRVRRGRVGLVGASGTGLQEVAVLLHEWGLGISHALGTGSNDVSDAVGGMTMIEGIRMLEADPGTEIIVLVSKPAGKSAKEKILHQLYQCRKPVIANFLGENGKSLEEKNIFFTLTLEETALKAAQVIRGAPPAKGPETLTELETRKWAKEKEKFQEEQAYIRGLFTGGTLAAEAALILRPMLPELFGNISLPGVTRLADVRKSVGHSIIDLGADEFTLGKPHPMLEPEMRRDRLLAEANDPGVRVILMDFVLGYGVHPDPVGATIPMLHEARNIALAKGRHLALVASICGTDEDPQNKAEQARCLRETGVVLLPSNAQAALAAARLVVP